MTHPTTIVIPTYTEKRWGYLLRTLESARAQTHRPDEIVVAVDHNPDMYARAKAELTGVTVLPNAYPRGVSGNRNTGAEHAVTPLVAFLDDDIIADRHWLARQIEPFADPAVVGTGGAIVPAWEGAEPRWMPAEFLWAVGGSYAGMPTETAPIRNVWSANMIVRRDAFLAVGGFRLGFGKLGDRNRPEDTDLCLRMSQLAGGRWMYVPSAVIQHEVPAERASFRFFVRRCYAEGRGKVQMAGLHDNDALGAERSYLWSLPKAFLRHLAGAARGQGLNQLLRAGGVAAGVAAAGVGGVVETVSSRRSARRPAVKAAP
ncbi:glycosyltransferase family 2 protein [Actinoplanes oblitus]|uniref:Glycosyltransferase family 2 protein n=1 Tax=Actinoplanes oblitus TaxID=3040509 RepID=A0ABY8WQV4_9ACTN|nr:glycosyltransferase family 2 protein [Actinoplanes oblitus]WIM99177.1 glycosyltransferase family 2 protein [Actinoplanes oblitus]